MTEQDEFLRANREAVEQQIRRGLDELDRGEGIPEDAFRLQLSAAILTETTRILAEKFRWSARDIAKYICS